MKIKKITILTIFTLLLFVGCGDKEQFDDDMSAAQDTTQQEPKFLLKTHDGKEIITTVKEDGWQFEGYENKVVLLNFFGTWCPPCIAEIPHLLNIREKLKDNFEIITVDIGKRNGAQNSSEELQEFIDGYGITYPMVSGVNVLKLFEEVRTLNPAGSIPFMVLFGKEGKYLQHYIGMKPEEMLYNDISQAIQMP